VEVDGRTLGDPWALDGVDPGEDVLELGPGLITDVLRQRTARLTALEIDPRLASSLRERMRNTNVEVVEADATAMFSPDGSFSAVLSFTMVHHVPSATVQDRLLAEALRVLRPAQSLTFANSIVTYIQYEYYFGTQHETSEEVR
jgi:16S rRNA A1518/A1519 N6-dimethyltransferase RsmA/KsgA/DIM1 with predicted DNA glycosylase/AP lyase activity